MAVERLREIVFIAVRTLFAQIEGGRVRCESEATLQLHLGRVITTVGDLALVHPRETFSIELEKPLPGAKRGRIDIWFRLTSADDRECRCAIELKFFKKANQREPNNRYEVFKDIARLECCKDVADLGFMLVATDHPHYVDQEVYSPDTQDFDLRHGKSYLAGRQMVYRTPKPHGPPITLTHDYNFTWTDATSQLRYMLLEVTPDLVV
ncbi:MAG: hypothetical protein ACT4N8_12680 [Sphingosinicella sp.]|uniref:hypothetical protein n=1 Tax=Sphingosinicella sp. TaxID=1917971 RepID=UPI004037DF2A